MPNRTIATDEITRHLVVDGVPLDSSSVILGHSSRPLFVVLNDPVEAKVLTEGSFTELAAHFGRLDINLRFPWSDLESYAMIFFEQDGSAKLKLLFQIDVSNWKGPYSVSDLAEGMKNSLSESQLQGLSWSDSWGKESDGFGFDCNIRDPMNRIIDEIEFWVEMIRPLYEQVRALLAAEVERDTLVTLFDFSPTVRTACEQYLLYFAQFLRDLGIEAQADIRHRAGQVLFSVKPEDGAEALDRIREALHTYLDLPSAPRFDSSVGDYPDIAVLQLQANIHHLKGQLMIASAVLRARDAEIEALQLSNYQYRQVHATHAEVDQLAALPPAGQDAKDDDGLVREEPLFGGLVTVTSYEGKGFKLALPEILRRLKRRFEKD